MVNAAVAPAYDLVAPEYDAQMARNPVAVEMRRQLHRHFDRVFRPGDHVLDLTAGTGADAFYLAARGIDMTALDISPGMIAELKRGAASRELKIQVHVLPAECLSMLNVRFEGAISTFAGLNTVDDLPLVARSLAACIRPYGRVIIHALNASCFWQTIADVVRRGQGRHGQMHVGIHELTHRLYNPHALWREVFAPYFELRETYALSVLAAPAIVTRMPRLAPLLFHIDRRLGYLYPAVGDFFVMDLERSEDVVHL